MSNVVVQHITQDPETGDYSVSYIYEETGEPYPYAEDTLTPIYEKVPRVICGVLYSMGKLANIMVNDKFKDNWDLFWENDMHRKNMIKFGSDAFTAMLMALLFKLAIKPLYTDWKSTSDENTLAENIIIDLLYNSSSRSYDGFMGPLAPIMFFGDNPSPPVY
jgi:hypothetical protein